MNKDPKDTVHDLHLRIQNQLAMQRVRNQATDDTWGFWKDPRTIFGIVLTCLFSAGWAAMSWNLGERSFEAGKRSVYEAACQASCERRISSMEHLRETRGTYACWCEDGARLIPIQSRLFSSFSED